MVEDVPHVVGAVGERKYEEVVPEVVDTTFILSDFERNDFVEFWTGIAWMRGNVKFVSKRNGTLQSRIRRAHTVAGILPGHVRHIYD